MRLQIKPGLAVVAMALSSGAVELQLTNVVIQKISAIEARQTVLADGEVTWTSDEHPSAALSTIRIGNGVTAGGTIASDPFSFKGSTVRTLSSAEYELRPTGVTAWSNGWWELITRRNSSTVSTANTGSIVISSAYPIASISFSSAVSNSLLSSISPITEASLVYTVEISASEISALYPVAVDFVAAINSIVVTAYTASWLVGATNDMRRTVILVANPAADAEPVSRGWHNADLLGDRGRNWAQWGATQQVDMAWYSIKFNDFYRLDATGTAGAVTLQHVDGATGLARGIWTAAATNAGYRIMAYTLGTNIMVDVADGVPFASAPVIQATATMSSNTVWTNCTTTTDWPVTHWISQSGTRHRVYRLYAGIGPSQQFYRVTGTITNTVSDGLTIHVPLIAEQDVIFPTNRWEDLVISPQGMNLAGAPGAATLEVDSGPSGNQIALRFPATGTTVAGGAFQLPHAWVAGTTVHPHIHFHHNTTDIGTSVWHVAYNWANIGGTFGTNLTATVTNAHTTAQQWVHQLLDVPIDGIPGTGHDRSSVLRWQVQRLGSDAADNYAGAIDVISADAHYMSRGTPVPFDP